MPNETTTREGHGASDPAGDATLVDRSPQRPTPTTADDLLVGIYGELHGLARQWFAAQPPDHTLQPTAIVHEAYLRLSTTDASWHSRTHFFAVAARAMRQVLIDHARRRRAMKRGGAWCRVELADDADPSGRLEIDILALHEALEQLGRFNERQCRIVELRFLAGLGVDETAETLGISPRTVKLEWRMARAWLLAAGRPLREPTADRDIVKEVDT